MKRLLLWLVLVLAALGAYALWPHVGADPEAEAARIAELLSLETGDAAADVGAGDGRMTLPLARLVAPGAAYATEVEAEKRLAIREAATEAGLENVLILEASPDRTNLPAACCDGILLRKVYHHLPQPEATAADLRRAVKPGGRVVVIDFALRWFLPKPDTAPESRSGHGVAPEAVIEEMTAAGFTLRERIDDWGGRNYCLVFESAGE